MKLIQEQKLEQQLVMTLEMKQSLEILQLPIIELKKAIDKELLENPLLEVIEKNVEQEISKEGEGSIEELYRDDNLYDEIRKTSSKNEDYNIDIISKLSSKKENVLEKTLKEIRENISDKLELTIYEYVIDNLDEKGFFREELKESINFFKVNYAFELKEETFEKLRKKLMGLNIEGLGSRDLKEFLAYQVGKKNGDIAQIANLVIVDHFDEFSRKKIRELKKNLNLSEKQLKEIYSVVSKCKPYPLTGYSMKNEKENIVIPEVIVKEENGEFEVYLNDAYLPELKLNNEYYKVLSQDKEALEYLKEKASKVRSLEKCIEQRNITLYRVTSEIVKLQENFFRKGEKELRPMTMYEVGEKLDLHESTISRVVNGKYMESPRGGFDLKYFFSGKVETRNGGEISVLAVKNIVREIIIEEDKKKPLTDKKISEIFLRKGIKISQRTVANYRENLKILPTYLRKEI